MSCEADSAEILRKAGHRMTPQRLLILRIIRHAQGHMTATQVMHVVHETYPSVDVSTVYRTLDALRRLRLVTSTDLGQGDILYEWAREEPHHHLVCTSCRAIQQIGHQHFDRLESALLSERGFRPDFDHFAIFGLCRECAAAEVTSGHAS
ncbi:MAG: Fur family transcriptional regulator [Tepidiformaceae bacterium]